MIIKSKCREPLYLELKDMLSVLINVREANKLWSSRYQYEGVDLFTSSIILWFTKDAFKKFRLNDELMSSYKALESFITLKLSEIETLSNIPPENLLEILQGFVTISSIHRSKELELKIYDVFTCNKSKGTLPILIRRHNPYECQLSTLIILSMLQVSKLQNQKNILLNYIEEYLDQVSKVKTANGIDVSSLYWIIVAIDKLLEMNLSKNPNFKHKITLAVKSVEYAVSKSVHERILEDLPLDKALWYYHIIEKLISVKKKLKEDIEKSIKSIHKELMNNIIVSGRISWITSTYGSLLYNLRREDVDISSYYSYIDSIATINLDLITLSLLISALVGMKKHIITYVTEYDLRLVGKIQLIAFIMGVLFLVIGSCLCTHIQQVIQFLRPYIVLYMPLDTKHMFWIILSIALYLVIAGISLLYDLSRGAIMKTKDIGKTMLKPIRILKILREVVK